MRIEILEKIFIVLFIILCIWMIGIKITEAIN